MTMMHEEKYTIYKTQEGKRYAEELQQKWKSEGRIVTTKENRQTITVESLAYDKVAEKNA